MLIRRAELDDGRIADVRIEHGRIAAIGTLSPRAGESALDAHGGRLLPGLHDHHVHVAALAASYDSVHCGPPDVTDPDAFAACLRKPGSGWLRAIGYHESVAGMLDASTLDRIVHDRPVRVQHRSGRMWFFNSAGLALLLARAAPPPGLERDASGFTGRLFDEDAWLQRALGSEPPTFAAVGRSLAALGVTGLTEMSPGNDAAMARHFLAQSSNGSLPQRILLAGRLQLARSDVGARVMLGPAKLHLHEARLPTLEAAASFVREAHERDRNVAIHCVTEVELVFALAALEAGGVRRGDRIEHASVANDYAVGEIARLGLAVVTQPHFIHERGDAYLHDVEPETHPSLYRLRAFLDRSVAMAAGSDAPFGGYDPWTAMACAVTRRTRTGRVLGADEALTPEQALGLYLCRADALWERRSIEVGAPADLCLLDLPWSQARSALSSERVRATLIDGRLVFDRIDETPA